MAVGDHHVIWTRYSTKTIHRLSFNAVRAARISLPRRYADRTDSLAERDRVGTVREKRDFRMCGLGADQGSLSAREQTLNRLSAEPRQKPGLGWV